MDINFFILVFSFFGFLFVLRGKTSIDRTLGAVLLFIASALAAHNAKAAEYVPYFELAVYGDVKENAERRVMGHVGAGINIKCDERVQFDIGATHDSGPFYTDKRYAVNGVGVKMRLEF